YYSGTTTSSGEAAYGTRRSISTYTREGDAPLGDASQGSISQSFVVPSDAIALRFYLHGGDGGRIALLQGGQVVYSATGPDNDALRTLKSWSLEALRGKTVRLVLEDTSSVPPYGYVGSTGFDLITGYNGP